MTKRWGAGDTPTDLPQGEPLRLHDGSIVVEGSLNGQLGPEDLLDGAGAVISCHATDGL